jgi:hypothetical protein
LALGADGDTGAAATIRGAGEGILPPFAAESTRGTGFDTAQAALLVADILCQGAAGSSRLVITEVTNTRGPNSGVRMQQFKPMVPIPARYIATVW